MKSSLLLIAIAFTAILFVPQNGLEAKTRVSFGINVGATHVTPPPAPVYCPPPAVVVRRPVYYQSHVPVGQGYYDGVVVYPYRAPQEVIVYPAPRPAPRWHNSFSFNWGFFR